MNKLYGPGPDGNNSDNSNTNWNEHPLGVDGPRHRLGGDAKLIDGQNQD